MIKVMYIKCTHVHVCWCLHSELVHDEDLTLGFVRLNNLPAIHAVQINNGQEYILCFNGKQTTYCYTYVDVQHSLSEERHWTLVNRNTMFVYFQQGHCIFSTIFDSEFVTGVH